MIQNTPARALILDFGSVVTYSLFETHRETERELGLPANSLTWMGPFDPASDPLWQSMLTDEISERDYWQTRSREVGVMLGQSWNTMADFVQRARGAHPMRIIRPEAIDCIERVKAGGAKLAILSNELDLFYGEDLRHKLPFMESFDAIIDATYTDILKPDPRAFQICLEALDVPAQDCIFIDDQIRNIRGAEAIGLPAIHLDIRNPAQAFSRALAAFTSQEANSTTRGSHASFQLS